MAIAAGEPGIPARNMQDLSHIHPTHRPVSNKIACWQYKHEKNPNDMITDDQCQHRYWLPLVSWCTAYWWVVSDTDTESDQVMTADGSSRDTILYFAPPPGGGGSKQELRQGYWVIVVWSVVMLMAAICQWTCVQSVNSTRLRIRMTSIVCFSIAGIDLLYFFIKINTHKLHKVTN